MKIGTKEVIEAIKQAAIVLIGAPLVLLIPMVGPLLAGLPVTAVSVVSIAWGQIVAGAVAVLVVNLVLAMRK